jgi:putative ABC transport system permease protein
MRTLSSRLRAAWVTLTGTGAAASVAFGLLVFASVLASLAIPRASVGLRDHALQRVITAAPPGPRIVLGTVAEPGMTDVNDEVVASDIAAVGTSLRAQLTAGGVPLAASPPAWSGLTTGYTPVSGTAPAAGYGQPQFEMTYSAALASYSRVVAGRLPASISFVGKRGVAQAAVTTATAARFGLRVGSQLNAGAFQLVITGIIQPADPAAAFWSLDSLAAKPTLTPGTSSKSPYWTGVVFVGPAALPLLESGLNPDAMFVSWAYPVALAQVTAGQAGGLAASVGSLVSSGATVAAPGIGGPVMVSVTSQVPSILSPFVSQESAVTPVLELLYVSLAVLGAVVVLLGARLVAQRRAAELTLMRARGASLYQLGWLVLRASAVIAGVAGAAAVALAVGLTFGDGDPLGWWLAGAVIAVTLVGPVLVSVGPQRVAAPVGGRPVRRAGGRRRAARRIVIETALVTAAVGGLAVLRSQGLGPANSGLYSSAAPVLVAIPVAVVVLRCYPFLARALARIAGRSRGVVAFVGLARATRTPPGTVLPSFALVLVLSMVAFPAMVTGAEARSQVAASWQQVGADAIVAAPSGAVISAALQRQVSSVPGVVATAAVVVEGGSLPNGNELSVVFVDPASYAAVVDQAPGPPFPLAALSEPGQPGTAGGGQAAVATADAAQLFAAASSPAARTGPVDLTVGSGASAIAVRLAGQVGGVPGVAPPAVVVPLQALGPSPPGPDLMLVAGPHLDVVQLSAVVGRALPGGSVTSRAAALVALTTAPVPHAAQAALTQGVVAAAGFGVLILLLSLLLTARTREMTLAFLATMGLRRWQAELLLAAETLPPVLAAAIGGIACAWLLAPLVGPALNLAAFSGSGTAVAVTPAVVPLVACAAGLVLAALLVLAVQAVITYHRGSTRALRIAD